jgi:hypothetical protein
VTIKYKDRDDAIDHAMAKAKERKEERVGICGDCKEWTSVEDACCGSPVYVDGGWVSPEEDEEEDDA